MDVVVLFIGFAGVLKFTDLSVFERALQSWTTIPESARALVVIGVPSLEVALAAAYVLGVLPRRLAALGALLFLLTATGLLAVQVYAFESTDCGCLGIFGARAAWLSDGYVSIWRNVVLMGLLTLGLVVEFRSGSLS